MEFEEKSSSSYCEVYGAGNPNFLRSKASEAVEIERGEREGERADFHGRRRRRQGS